MVPRELYSEIGMDSILAYSHLTDADKWDLPTIFKSHKMNWKTERTNTSSCNSCNNARVRIILLQAREHIRYTGSICFNVRQIELQFREH